MRTKVRITIVVVFFALALAGAIVVSFSTNSIPLNATDGSHYKAVQAAKPELHPIDQKAYLDIHAYGAPETEGNEKLNFAEENRKPWLLAYLSRAVHDELHTPRWRNYCVQHAATNYILTREIEYFNILQASLLISDPAIADVAVFSHARIVRELNLSTNDALSQQVLQVMRDNLETERPTDLKVAAIRAVVLLKTHEFDSALNLIAFNADEALPTRIAAIDAIGVLGISASETQLKVLGKNPNNLLRQASINALRKIHPLESVLPKSAMSIDSLRVALQSEHLQIRNEAISELHRWGRNAIPALPEISNALSRLNEHTTEHEAVSYLQLLRNLGPEAAVCFPSLINILDERSFLYKGKNKSIVHRLRAYALLTITDVGHAQDALPFIADALANSDSDMQMNFAAGSYAASSLGPNASPFVRFLIRALRPTFLDKEMALNQYRAAVTDRNRTSARLEAIRALGQVGSSANEAIPFLERLSSTESTPSSGLPLWRHEAKVALQKIRGETNDNR